MFVYTNSYGNIVRWQNEKNVDIEEIEDDIFKLIKMEQWK